jgi:hypothetical protein
VAIKEPTCALIRRQSGANVLLVGQQPEAALGVLATCLVSLAAQHPATGVAGDGDGRTATRYFLLDGTPPDSPDAGYWRRLADHFPHDVQTAGPRDAARLIAELDEEVTRREAAGADEAPAWFLIVYDLGRFRDLRKAEDDFGFGESKGSTPAKQFAHVLREGPALGVHVLVWCDTYNNLTRMLDRQGVRDFEIRVLFQMSGTDSSNLIDSPAAGRLGVHRALLYSEEEAQLEKFRPYGRPDPQWLAWVKSQLAARAPAAAVGQIA